MSTEAVTVPPVRTPTSRGSDFAELSRRIKAAGLLERQPRYYLLRATALGGVTAATVAAFVMLGNSWWQLVVAVVLAALSGQLALIAHDLAHRQIFRTRRPSQACGLVVGNLLLGMSYGWWMDKHTRHHANPNHEELDPDVAPDIIVWSQRQARSSRGIARRLAPLQGYLFLPLLTFEGLNLHASAVRAVARPGLKQRRIEAVLLVGHAAVYISALLLVLSPAKALAFAVVHKALWGGYLGAIFAPNHKGMPTLTGNDRPDFLRRQVLTSRNVTGGRVVDVALGGLNHQIEHHLFPSMATPALRQARPIVKDYCREVGVDYAEASLVSSYAQALRHLHHVGAPLRDAA
ncbi:fatty acid desaturase family protein [Luteipulveratus mongoliensis]|uniref:Delta fatty acid desaturase n=1 Tax=Luteipulveratus mongoliensis TaxID=571913 RepID=A0A0K1JJY4_9MICO|nr:acyl-CoA desaturase [Luteipulveratus mongoliensis]AKU17039.1 delta fatty acid desaturase [Luteipulveratus mongoliensis]